MPELPEVETIVRGLQNKILDTTITSTQTYQGLPILDISQPLADLIYHKITEVRRRGKLIIIKTSTPIQSQASKPKIEEIYLMVHLGMTGALLIKDSTTEPSRYCKFALQLKNSNQEILNLFFEDIRRFGRVYVSKPNHLDDWPFWKNLGPEPFDIEPQAFYTALNKISKKIKNALLDQKIIAGLGNIYVDESLFASKIHPQRKTNSLSESEATLLLSNIKNILKQSIEKSGTSFRNYRDADGHKGDFQNFLAVYGKEDQPCPRCHTKLTKLTVAGRSTIICPCCQKME